MLGPQFKDTYYEDESGTQRSFISGEEGKVTEVAGPVMAGRSLQGMLFDPHTATGSKQDPMVSREQRVAAIESGYKLDKENHALTHKRETGKTAGARKLEGDRKLSIESIAESGIPIQEMRNPNNPAVVSSSASSYRTTAGGHYTPSGDRAWTKIQSRKEKVVTEGSRVPTAGSGELLVNPKPLTGGDPWEGGHRLEGYFTSYGTWSEDEEKPDTRTPADYERYDKDMASYTQKMGEYEEHQRKKEAGEATGYMSKPWEPTHPDDAYERQQKQYEYEKGLRIEGVEAHHLFTKPAPETNPNVFSEQVGRGFKQLQQGGDTDTEYYTRQPASEWETKSVTTWKNERSAPQSTMVHEIGHGVHMEGYVDPASNREYNRGADPFEESQADAYTDIHSSYSDRTAEAVDPTGPSRNLSLSIGGYGSKSDLWSNDTERALYRVARQAAASGGSLLSKSYKRDAMKEATGGETHLRDSTGGESHLSYINRGNTMALGRMLSENPDLHDVFTHVPEAGRHSSEEHMTRMATAATKAVEAYTNARNERLKIPKTEQLSLDV